MNTKSKTSENAVMQEEKLRTGSNKVYGQPSLINPKKSGFKAGRA